MTGGPPASMPTIKVPPRAVQHVTIEKLNPIMPSREKERLSSVEIRIWRFVRLLEKGEAYLAHTRAGRV
jgi:hypothetical protein